MNTHEKKIVRKLINLPQAKEILTEDEYRYILFSHPKPDPIKALSVMGPARTYNAWELKRAYEKAFNESYDWHEYSDLLDKMSRFNLAICTGVVDQLAEYKRISP